MKPTHTINQLIIEDDFLLKIHFKNWVQEFEFRFKSIFSIKLHQRSKIWLVYTLGVGT